jgi:hypothetical protein
MELAWQWREYGISISILRERVHSRTEPAKAEESVEPIVRGTGTEKVHRDYLLASGSRYVAPMR